MARYYYADVYSDREELAERLEKLKEIRWALRDACAEAEELGVSVSIQDYALHMEIVELDEQLAAMDEADDAELGRGYMRGAL